MDILSVTEYMAVINGLTFFLYWFDKNRAVRHAWRIPENILLLAAAMGGSPAAFLAMRLLRHKTGKLLFRVCYWLIVGVQLGGIIFILYSRAQS